MPGRADNTARDAAERVVRRLQEAGYIAYFAGGCVRDELLGRAPSDYDVATDADPDRIRQLFRRTSEVGVAFGVVLVRDFAETIEVATFRSDGPYTDRRRPDAVTFSDAQSDASRRDFTINALFLDPNAPPAPEARHVAGRVIDFVGGLSDLEAQVVRAVGDPDARLGEDHLRALRAVRFAARLGFELEARTFEAMRVHASELVGVSRERIGEELRRILAHPTRVRAVQLLSSARLDSPSFNEPGHDGPTPTLALLPAETSFPLALAALLLDWHGLEQDPGPIIRRWRSALVLSNDERDELAQTLDLVRHLERDWAAATIAQRKRWAASAPMPGALRLLARNPSQAAVVAEDVRKLEASPGGIAPTPLLSGDALIEAGFVPGPGFGDMLNQMYDAQLEGRLESVEQAFLMARELAGRLGVQTTGRR